MRTLLVYVIFLRAVTLVAAENIDDSLVQVKDGNYIGCGVVVNVWPDSKDSSKPPRVLALIATAEHVAGVDTKEPVVIFDDFSKSKATFLVADKDHDQSLILAWAPDGTPSARIAAKTPETGDKAELHAVWHALIIDGLVWPTRVSPATATRVSSDRTVMLDGFTHPGDSGGALINESGELIGIVSGGWKPFEDSTFGTRIWPIQGGGIEPLKKLIASIPVREDSGPRPR